MLARHLRCVSLIGAPLVTHLTAWLTLRPPGPAATEVAALATLLAGPHPDHRVRFGTQQERLEVVLRALDRLTSHRPVVLWLDDAQWGAEALALVSALLDPGRPPLPVLVVATLQQEGLSARPRMQDAVDALLSHRSVSSLPLLPLDAVDHRTLVRHTLGLAPRLAERVEARTSGNPLFATQLIRDWIQRGLLRDTDRGFDLEPGPLPGLPEHLRQVWTERIDAVLADRSEPDRIAVEAAAVLGEIVSGADWQSLCERLALPQRRGLLRTLANNGLVQLMPGGDFAFVHGMLRETLEELSRQAGRAPHLHGTAADVLLTVSGPDVGERRFRHLHQAGRVPEAAALVVRVLDRLRRTGAKVQALQLLEEAMALLVARELPADDPSRGDIRALGALIVLDVDGARAVLPRLDRLREEAMDHGWTRALAKERFIRAICAKYIGDPHGALPLYAEAVALLEGGPYPQDLAIALCNRSQTLRGLGRWDEAAHDASWALSLVDPETFPFEHTNALLELSSSRPNTAESARLAAQVLAVAERAGLRTLAAAAWNTLGESARARSDLDEAIHSYRKALVLARLTHQPTAVMTGLLNLAILQFQLGDAESAVRYLVDAERGRGATDEAVSSVLDLAGALGHMSGGRRSEAEARLARAISVLDRVGYVELDIAWLADRLWLIARDHGATAVAGLARGLARRQLVALGRPDDLGRLGVLQAAG